MSQAKLTAARELIQEKKYAEAEAILNLIDHPTAKKWLAQIKSYTSSRSNYKRTILPLNNHLKTNYQSKVLTQKDRWFSGKFNPESLETALNAYGEQGWCVNTATTATFPGFFSTGREELIVFMERYDNSPRMEYKVLTQKDRWFSGKFNPETIEKAINEYALLGWQVKSTVTASFPGFMSTNREEIIIILERSVK